MRNFLYSSLLLILVCCVCSGVAILSKKTKIPQKLDFDFRLQAFLDENFRFDSMGLLTLNGKMSEPHRRVNLFFKERDSLLCESNDKEAGVHFDIIVCVRRGGNCTKGMKICYHSELSEKKAKEAKFRMNKQYDGIECEDSSMHGLLVTADNTTYRAHEPIAENSTFRGNISFKIYSSIDKNSYTFNVSNNGEAHQCFKIRVGTEKSVFTEVTNFENEQIVTEPKLEELSGNWTDKGWADSPNNFNLFALDFIPMKNDWEKYFGDYYKTFYYVGGDKECNMIMKFHGQRLEICKPEWVATDRLKCTGYRNRTSPDDGRFKKSSVYHGNFTFKQANNGKKYPQKCCKSTNSVTTMSTQTELRRSTKTSSYWNIEPSFNGISHEESFSLSLTPLPISKVVNVFKLEQYTKKTFTTKHSKSAEEAYGKIMTNSVTRENSIEYCVDPCEELTEEQLVLNCLGWQLNTGYLRAYVERQQNCG